MRNRLLRITATTAVWTALGMVLSIEVYFNMRAEMSWGDFVGVAIPQFGRAAMWGCLAPFILMLREKVPLSAGRWIGGILYHLAFSFVVMATFYLGRIEAISYFFGPEPGGYWRTAFRSFYGHNIVDMAYYWAVIAYGYAAELQKRYRNQEIRAAQLESRLIEAELKALREQLKPHFLFNTLNTIAALAREGKNETAVTLIARLGSLLRMSLEGNHRNETTLRVEMDFLERYIEIQKARFPDRLSVGISVDEAALDVPVPWLLLQPIVENAILHGVAPKVGAGRVDILGSVEDGMLLLEVRDDGPGLPDNRRVVEGTGLANTRERLAKTYGDRARMSISGGPAGGITVRINLPSQK